MANKMAEKDTKEEIMKVLHAPDSTPAPLQAFKLFDDDETGNITFSNLRRVAKELGENLTDEELQVFPQKFRKKKPYLIECHVHYI